MRRLSALVALALALALGLAATASAASLGMTELPSSGDGGPVTVFYPTTASARTVQRGPFALEMAADAPPLPGNQRLVVVSHGSPASPWVHTDLARMLVDAGFVVAMPEHFADNANDPSEPGPPSWRRRPLEVSRAIDRLQADARFSGLVDFTRVGMFGMSAGGHTALVLAGGRWSPSRLLQHCEGHLARDFHACAGPFFTLDGGALDAVKMAMVRFVIRRKLDDAAWYGHTDPRITAIVAGVPFAADFDVQTLQAPRPVLGLVAARQDRWLAPQFHVDAIRGACRTCELVADLPTAGHGALLSPLPPGRPAGIEALVGDPPGFDRAAVVPDVHGRITRFFQRHLLGR